MKGETNLKIMISMGSRREEEDRSTGTSGKTYFVYRTVPVGEINVLCRVKPF